MKLKNIKALVEHILKNVPATRSSDMRLYYEVCSCANPGALEECFGDVIMNLDSLNLPPFESVRRSRQKVQAEHPELAADDVVQVFRAENEQEYRDFARC